MNWEEKLDNFIEAYDDYHDMVNREDWVNWSEENEAEALDKYLTIRNELIERLEWKGGSDTDDKAIKEKVE